jgi:oligopeptidase B
MNPDAKATAPAFLNETQGNSPITRIAPPLARRDPVEHVIHGDRRVDHYAWLRQKENPEVIAYLEAENAYTDAILEPTEALQETLYQEMLGRILQTDVSVPYQLRGYLYFTATEEGKQYPVHCRRFASEGSLDEVLLDLNRLAEGLPFLGLGAFDVSDDNQLLAYALDTTGFRQYTLQIKNLWSGELFPQRMERVTGAAWAADNRALFYTVEDETTKRSHRLYRHIVGSGEADALIYEEADERFRLDIERTRSGAFLLLTIASHTTTEVRFLAASQPLGEFRVIAPREAEHEYHVDHHPNPLTRENRGANPFDTGGYFLIRTNSGGRTFRLASVPVADPQRSKWRKIVRNRPEVMIAGLDAFRSHLVLLEREGGLPYLRIVDLSVEAPDALAASHRIEMPEAAYNAVLENNPEFDADFVRFQYESFVTPRSVFDYDVRTRESVLRKVLPVLGGYDASQYVIERLHVSVPTEEAGKDAPADQGGAIRDSATDSALGVTRVPISVVYRRDTPRDGTAPLLLYGYGSYGISMPLNFSSNRLSLLNRGVIFAVAHIRGGGELGKPWHDAGRLHKKRNTFHDFIAAAEYLIAGRYTSPQKLVIEGGSAGGLLMGATANMRPDLFRMVISHVPFVDVLNTMLDASLPLTVGEYEEWGDPGIADDYFYMKSYCPYTNVEAKDYPAMLVKTGLNDSQVMYWEPAKYVSKLRALKTDANPLLFKINMGAGHGGASGRYDYLREIALDYAFLLTEFGVRE